MHAARSQATLERSTSHAWERVMQPFQTKPALTLVSATPSPRGGGMDAVGVSVCSSVFDNSTCMSGSLPCIEHASREVYMSACLHVCMSACSRSTQSPCSASTSVVAWDSSRAKRGSHGRTAWVSLDSPIMQRVQPMRVTANNRVLIYNEHDSETELRNMAYRCHRPRRINNSH